MKSVSRSSSRAYSTKNTLTFIVQAGFTAGLLDAIGAILIYCVLAGKSSVMSVFQFIASGVVGPKAFKGGPIMAAYGVFWHFVIAFIFAAIYVLAATRVRFLKTQPIVSGLIYGAFIWTTMNFIVVPLSATPKSPFVLNTAVILVIIWHLLFVGVPIALITAKRFNVKI